MCCCQQMTVLKMPLVWVLGIKHHTEWVLMDDDENYAPEGSSRVILFATNDCLKTVRVLQRLRSYPRNGVADW